MRILPSFPLNRGWERCWCDLRSTRASGESVYKSLHRNTPWDDSLRYHKLQHLTRVLLSSMRYFDRAALFLEACLKYGAIEVSEDTDILCRDMCAEEEADAIAGFRISLGCAAGEELLYRERSVFWPSRARKEGETRGTESERRLLHHRHQLWDRRRVRKGCKGEGARIL